MGLNFRILLESTTKEYFPGEFISGQIVILNDASVDITALQLIITGECEVHFSELKNHLERSSDGQVICRKRMINRNAKEVYLQSVVNILDPAVEIIPPGRHEYSFQYELPTDLPPSFDGVFGNIFYHLKAELHTFRGPDCETTMAFRILGIADLRLNDLHLPGQKITKRKCFGCFECRSGTADFTLQLQSKGAYVGDYIPFVLEVNNDSAKVLATKVSLIQIVTFHTRRKKLMTTKLTCAIAGPSIVPGDFDVWAGKILQVPPCVPSGLGGACNLIDVNYELKVEMLGRGLPCLEGAIPIVIGARPPPGPTALPEIPTTESPPSYEMAIVCSDNMRITDYLPMDTLDIQPPAYFP